MTDKVGWPKVAPALAETKLRRRKDGNAEADLIGRLDHAIESDTSKVIFSDN